MKQLLVVLLIAGCVVGCGVSSTEVNGDGYGVFQYALAGSYTSGIFRSTDRGITWGASNMGVAGLENSGIYAFGSSSNGKLFAAIYNGVGLVRSTDGGATWTQLQAGPNGSAFYNVMAMGNTIFAGGSSALVRSTDDGATWTDVHLGLPLSSYWGAEAAIGRNLFVGNFQTSGVWRSTDSGSSWQSASGGLAQSVVEYLYAFGTTLFAATWGSGIYRSTDLGESWTATSSPRQMKPIVSVGSVLFAGGDSGLYRSSDNGLSWRQETAVPSSEVLGLASSGSYILVASYGPGLFHSSDGGTTWSHESTGLSDTAFLSVALK